MCSPLSVVHGSDPDHEGWTRSRYEGGGRKKPGRIIKRELSSEERAHTGRTHTGTHGQSRGALMQLGARRAVDSLFFCASFTT